MQVEIPLADSLKDAEAVVAMQKQTGLVAMVGHTRRFNPSHQYVHKRIAAGEFNIQQMDVQTYFFRRTNMNALGQPRSWTDHLLWHHAAHTVDLFAYQCGSPIVKANAMQGPIHPTLGIAMDMSIQLKAENGAICTLSLSFNNDGPLGTFFRYIGDTATYIARYDDLYHRQGREDRRQQGRRLDERHRTAGPRVLRRHPRGPRAQRQRRAGAAVLSDARRAGEAVELTLRGDRTSAESDRLVCVQQPGREAVDADHVLLPPVGFDTLFAFRARPIVERGALAAIFEQRHAVAA